MLEKEFHCMGSMMMKNKNRPNEMDMAASFEFAKSGIDFK